MIEVDVAVEEQLVEESPSLDLSIQPIVAPAECRTASDETTRARVVVVTFE
jgi:hypothetical protein